MATASAPPLTIPDMRRRGHSQPPLSIRLPADLLAGLDSQADRLQTTRAGLCRALLIRGVEQLEGTAAP